MFHHKPLENLILLKTSLRRLHLLLALACSLFLISLSISGALLVFAKEIQATINPQYWLISKESRTNLQQSLPLAQLAETITTRTGQNIQFIERAEKPLAAWQVRLANKKYLSINPYTGDILLEYSFYNTFYGFVMAWHRWLLYSNDKDEKPLQIWISIASLVFIIELMLGSYLWAKPKNRMKRLKIRWQAKNRVLFHQLHGTIGIIFAIPLILIAFSGMAFFWQDATKQIVEWLTLSEVQQHNYQHQPLPNRGEFQLDKAYDTAHLALDNSEVYRIYLPDSAGSPLALRIKMPNESHAYSWSWANPYTGELLSKFDASTTSTATQVWNFKYKLHTGDFIGWPVKVLWLIISLIPSFFVISGIYLWLKRKPRQNQ